MSHHLLWLMDWFGYIHLFSSLSLSLVSYHRRTTLSRWIGIGILMLHHDFKTLEDRLKPSYTAHYNPWRYDNKPLSGTEWIWSPARSLAVFHHWVSPTQSSLGIHHVHTRWSQVVDSTFSRLAWDFNRINSCFECSWLLRSLISVFHWKLRNVIWIQWANSLVLFHD